MERRVRGDFVALTGLMFGNEAVDRYGMKGAIVDVKRKLRIASLTREMDELHRADGVFWRDDLRADPAAQTRHRLRKQRLEAIRRELSQLSGQA